MYPDLSIVCGDEILKDNIFDTLTNPSVIIEVASPYTIALDLGYNFFFYKQFSTSKEYLVIDPNRFFATVYTKQPDNSCNLVDITCENSKLKIHTIQLNINFADSYYRIELDK